MTLAQDVSACYKDGIFDLTRFDWFHGKISAIDASASASVVGRSRGCLRSYAAVARSDKLIANTAKGTFLVRVRRRACVVFVRSMRAQLSSQASNFVIVWMPADGAVPAHIRVSPLAGGGFTVQGNKQEWKSLPQIVNVRCAAALSCGRVELRRRAARQAWAKKHLKNPCCSRNAALFDRELRAIQSREVN